VIRLATELEPLQTRVFDPRRSRASRILFLSLIALLLTFALRSMVSPKRMDFAVCWYDVRGIFKQGLPLYGPHSAFAAPMLFRYPPVFALLFYPLTWLSFKWAGILLALLEASAISTLTNWSYRKLKLDITLMSGFLALAICASYFYLSFKDGNVQWLDTCLVLSGNLLATKRPSLAGLCLAMGIASKVWPILFLPWFFSPRKRAALLATAGWSAVIWLFPLLVWSRPTYSHLLQTWFHQEFSTNTGVTDIWYPSQSLRGVMLRYLTDPALTLPYRSQFPDVHLTTFPPAAVIHSWCFIATMAFGCAVARRQISGELYFVMFSALQPFCNWSSLISLAPAVLVAASISSNNWKARCYLTSAFALSCVGYMASLSRFDTRLFEALGLHFPIMLCIGMCLLQKVKRRPTSIVLGPPD
jgi:hypothetical protein